MTKAARTVLAKIGWDDTMIQAILGNESDTMTLLDEVMKMLALTASKDAYNEALGDNT
jgi:hypothetical protein